MTPAEFETQFARLAAHFHLPTDESRDTIAADWLQALKHYHVEAFDHAVTELTRTATDRFWPPLGKVLELIKARIGRYDRPAGACATCHGSSWVEAPMFDSNGLIYTNVLARCPDCGVPAPKETAHGRRQRVSDLQQHEYQAGRYGRNQMPPGMAAKHPEKVGNPEFKAWADALKKKLFGTKDDVA